MADHPACLEEEAILAQCVLRRGKRGGPGGQHRNKVESAVRLVHGPTGVEGQASERREPARNHAMALRRLRVNLALEARGWFGLKDVPSARWQSRVRRGKAKTAVVKKKPVVDELGRVMPPVPERAGGRPGAGRVGGVIACNAEHWDYPALLAELLDVLALKRWDPGEAAVLMGVSATQLVKLLKKEPAALDLVNAERSKRGLRPLR